MSRVLGWLACAVSVVLLVVAMVTGTAPALAAPVATVTDAWVRLPAVPGRPAAGYFTLKATTPARLTGVTSPAARVELHSMAMAGGVMHMAAMPSVAVAAGQTIRFAPGGDHLMLFDLPAGVAPGSPLVLTFTFAGGASQTVAAAVVPAGAPAAGHGGR